MRIGMETSQHRLEWPELVARVRFAEEAGFDGAWVFDHFKPLYGEGPGPCLEGWTLLAGLAAATERIRLATLVTGITYRHPSLLAAEAVTVDHISGGRLELAVGAAWFEAEHRELGFDFPPAGQRVELLEEAIEVMRLLMTTDGARYEGEHLRLEGATYRPRPVQRPYPPLWIGASGEQRMLPLVGRVADAWHSFAAPDDMARKWAIVAGSAEAAGRDPDSILRATNLSLSEPWDEVRRVAEAHRRAGVGYLVCSWPTEGRSRMEEFVERILPDLAAS
ncbi:MAG TPA: TIGR03560 family F420-dependent LLM class oxidoreductase [Acidimicrobiales bacterium]|nr:TIGR03560 family F420-dependent LLM class oxidoreductase [Acidimicrobiales bacterium]